MMSQSQSQSQSQPATGTKRLIAPGVIGVMLLVICVLVGIGTVGVTLGSFSLIATSSATTCKSSSSSNAPDVNLGGEEEEDVFLQELYSLPPNPYKNKISVSIIVVASAQRSSSTSFQHALVAADKNCSINLGEPFNPVPTEGKPAFLLEGWADHNDDIQSRFGRNSTTLLADMDPSLITEFLIRRGQHECAEKLLLQQNCNNHCNLMLRHFDLQLAPWQHSMLWDSQQLRAAETIAKNTNINDMPPPFAMAILERTAIKDRWRSTWYSRQTRDYTTTGSEDHKKIIESLGDQVPPVPLDFSNQHNKWYRLVRGYVKMTNQHRVQRGLPEIPTMEVTYDQFTNTATGGKPFVKKEFVKLMNYNNNNINNHNVNMQ